MNDIEHIRQNILTGEWVIYSPQRGKRPRDIGDQDSNKPERPSYDPSCPFCPGQENRLTTILHEVGTTPAHSWQTRVIRNKYPALTPRHKRVPDSTDLFPFMDGYGHHEVIIEHPRHDLHLSRMHEREVQNVLKTLIRRYTYHQHDPLVQYCTLFKNRGPNAGTSLIHPHCQLIAVPTVPYFIGSREFRAENSFEKHGVCLVCRMMEEELQEQSRMVALNEHFAALVPFAAAVPYELWIIPRRHQSDMTEIRDTQWAALARILQGVLLSLDKTLEEPDYNLAFQGASQFQREIAHLHWFIQIQPRLVTQAGFEMGSGMRINPLWPETAAQRLQNNLSTQEKEKLHAHTYRR